MVSARGVLATFMARASILVLISHSSESSKSLPFPTVDLSKNFKIEKAYYINVDHDVERKNWVEDILQKTGLEYERVNAVSPSTLTKIAEMPELARLIPSDKIWETKGGFSGNTKRQGSACSDLSHRVAYQKVAENANPGWYLVLEDDIRHFDEDFKAKLTNAMKNVPEDYCMLRLGIIGKTTEDDRVKGTDWFYAHRRRNKNGYIPVETAYYGAHAVLFSQSKAAEFMEMLKQRPLWSADKWTGDETLKECPSYVLGLNIIQQSYMFTSSRETGGVEPSKKLEKKQGKTKADKKQQLLSADGDGGDDDSGLASLQAQLDAIDAEAAEAKKHIEEAAHEAKVRAGLLEVFHDEPQLSADQWENPSTTVESANSETETSKTAAQTNMVQSQTKMGKATSDEACAECIASRNCGSYNRVWQGSAADATMGSIKKQRLGCHVGLCDQNPSYLEDPTLYCWGCDTKPQAGDLWTACDDGNAQDNTPELPTHTQEQTSFPKTCAETGGDGTGTAFDCSGDANDIDAAPAGITCADQTNGCTAAECCTVTPGASGFTCGDTDGTGTAFDCSGDANDIDAAPTGITCADQTNGCTATECCTVVPGGTVMLKV